MWINRQRYEAMLGSELLIKMLEARNLALLDVIQDLKDRLRLALDRQDREQQRADNALSLAVRVKTGQDSDSPPVTPSLPELDPHQEDDAEVEAIRQDIVARGPIDVMLSYK